MTDALGAVCNVISTCLGETPEQRYTAKDTVIVVVVDTDTVVDTVIDTDIVTVIDTDTTVPINPCTSSIH